MRKLLFAGKCNRACHTMPTVQISGASCFATGTPFSDSIFRMQRKDPPLSRHLPTNYAEIPETIKIGLRKKIPGAKVKMIFFFLDSRPALRQAFNARPTIPETARNKGADMSELISLRQMKVGQHGKIARVEACGEVNQRIRDMGLIPGAKVSVVGRAPLKDPVALRLSGVTISLRNREADHITVEIADHA